MMATVYATPRQWVITALFVAFGVMAGFFANVLYTNHVDRQSNQAWCDIINQINTRYQALDKPDPDAARFRDGIATLKAKYDC